MNRWRAVVVALLAVGLAGVSLHSQAQSGPDTWHGGGHDVVVLEPRVPAPDVVEQDPGTLGVLPNTGWVSVLGYEFRGRSTPYEYGTNATNAAHWCEAGDRFADARIDIPHNATIQFFRMWGLDSSVDHNVAAFLFESCLPNLNAGAPVNTNLQEIGSSGATGPFTISSSPFVGPTDLERCTYFVRVRFGAGCAGEAQTTVRKIRVQYELQP